MCFRVFIASCIVINVVFGVCEVGDDGNDGACNFYFKQHICNRTAKKACPIINQSNDTFHLGVALPLSGNEVQHQASERLALTCGISKLEEMYNYTVKPYFSDTNSTAIGGLSSAVCFEEQGVHAILGAFSSQASQGVAAISKLFDTIVLSHSSSSPELSDTDWLNGFPTFSRVFPSDNEQSKAIITLIKHYNWNSIAMVSNYQDSYSDGIAKNLRLLAKDAGIIIATDIQFNVDNISLKELELFLQQIQNGGSRIIVFAGTQYELQVIFKVADNLGITKKGWQWIVTDAILASNWLKEEGYFGTLGVAPSMRQDSERLDELKTCFSNYLNSNFDFNPIARNLSWVSSVEPNIFDATMYDAILLLGQLFEKSRMSNHFDFGNFDSIPIENLLNILRSQTFEGASGTIVFDDVGDRLDATYSILNVKDISNWRNPVAYVNTNEKKYAINPDYPDNVVFMGGTTEVPPSIMLNCSIEPIPQDVLGFGEGLQVFCFVIIVIFVIFNISHRQHAIITLSSWKVNIIFSIGLAIATSSTLVMSNDSNSIEMCDGIAETITGYDHNLTKVILEDLCSIVPRIPSNLEECQRIGGAKLCMRQYWLFGIGFCLSVGTLLAKQARMLQVFNVKTSRRDVRLYSDWKVLRNAMLITLPMALLLVFWSTQFPVTVNFEKVRGIGGSVYIRETCHGEQLQNWRSIFGTYCSCLLFAACLIAYAMKRTIFIAVVNDWREITFSVYNCVLLASIRAAVRYSDLSRTMSFVLDNIVINFTVIVTILFHMAPKVWIIYFKRSFFHDASVNQSTKVQDFNE